MSIFIPKAPKESSTTWKFILLFPTWASQMYLSSPMNFVLFLTFGTRPFNIFLTFTQKLRPMLVYDGFVDHNIYEIPHKMDGDRKQVQ